MKRVILTAIFTVVGMPVFAQTPPQDPEINTYQQLLTEANSRIAGLNKLNQSLQAKIQDLQKAVKPSVEVAPAPEPAK